MYELIIDGEEIRTHEFMQPLIEELDYYAKSAGFESATIRRSKPVAVPKTPYERMDFERDWDRRVAEGKKKSP